MKLKYKFEWVNIDGEIIAVPLEEQEQSFHGVLKINETTQAIMELLIDETDQSRVVAALEEDHPDMSAETIREYVSKTIVMLRDNGLLSE